MTGRPFAGSLACTQPRRAAAEKYVILAIAILVALGMQLVQSPSVRFEKSPAMEIPMTVPYAAIPVGCAVMMVNVLRGAWRTWRGRQTPATHVEVA